MARLPRTVLRSNLPPAAVRLTTSTVDSRSLERLATLEGRTAGHCGRYVTLDALALDVSDSRWGSAASMSRSDDRHALEAYCRTKDGVGLPRFVVRDGCEHEGHRFTTYDCESHDDKDLVEELAERIRELYVDEERLRAVLEQSIIGLEPVADPALISGAIADTINAAVPEPGQRQERTWLDLPRNELAEVLAYFIAEEVSEAVVPATRVREKEVPGQPPRGLDLLAFLVEPAPRLLITEVKASEQASSPPAVVGSGPDSLRGQLLAFLHDRKRVLTELNWVMKHAPAAHEEMVGRAMLLWVAGSLPITLVPLLVRTTTSLGTNDYGVFHQAPGQFSPALVQFELICLPSGLADLAEQVYNRARGVA